MVTQINLRMCLCHFPTNLWVPPAPHVCLWTSATISQVSSGNSIPHFRQTNRAIRRCEAYWLHNCIYDYVVNTTLIPLYYTT